MCIDDSRFGIYEAVAIQDGRIVKLGSAAEVKTLAGPQTRHPDHPEELQLWGRTRHLNDRKTLAKDFGISPVGPVYDFKDEDVAHIGNIEVQGGSGGN